jgi:amidohydrolase
MIEPKVLKLKDEVVQLRRTFHMYPEIEFDLQRTSQIVADYLESLGLEVKRNVAKTGVVGLLRGGRPGKTIMLRADMDALPLQELNEVPYRSRIDGAMHAWQRKFSRANETSSVETSSSCFNLPKNGSPQVEHYP